MMAKKKKYDFRLVHHNDFRRHAAKPRRVKLECEKGEGEAQKPRKKPKRRLILMKPGARVVAWHRRNPINFIGSLWLMNGGASCIYRVSHEHLLWLQSDGLLTVLHRVQFSNFPLTSTHCTHTHAHTLWISRSCSLSPSPTLSTDRGWIHLYIFSFFIFRLLRAIDLLYGRGSRTELPLCCVRDDKYIR